MPMLIGRFHALIQSRITWIVFLVVIVFSFVIWGTPFLFSGRGELERGAAGMLDGRPVSRHEFWEMLQHVRLAVAFNSSGRLPPVDERTEPVLRKLAWRRLASLREAARLGLTASDAEVREAVRSQPMFQLEGRFHPESYRNFLARFLGEQGLGEGFFLEHMAQELALRRLRMAVAQSVLAPPADVERIYSVLEDRFIVDYVEAPPPDPAGTPTPSDDELKEFFQRNRQRYEVPPRVVVKYVHFDAARHLAAVPDPAADEIEDYYDEHRAEFTVLEPDPATSTNLAGAVAATQTVSRVRPLEEVRTNIVTELRRRMAHDRAEQEAMEFVARISPDRPTGRRSFDEAALEFKVEPRVSPPLLADQPLATLDAGLAFNRAAFELRDNDEDRFSQPVRAPSGYYVLWLVERMPARVPELEEIRPEVLADAREDVAVRARRAELEALMGDLRRGATSLAEAAARWKTQVHTTPEFSTTSMPTNHPFVERLVREIATCNAGEYAGPAELPSGGYVIGRVVHRAPAPRVRLAGMAGPIADLILRERENSMFEAFEEELLKARRFEDRLPPPRAVEDAGDG